MSRRKLRNYFGRDTEESIISYNEADDVETKRAIYELEIHPALDKLVENVIHKYKFYYYDSTYEDLKHDTVVYLHERLDRFTRDKGKAYSYFTVVARNFLIVKNSEAYEGIRNRDELQILDDNRDLPNEIYTEERQVLLTEFVREWSIWGVENINMLFERERDQKIAEAVFVLFRNCDDIDNYNKKALYILIREHANVKTQYITKVVNYLKDMFKTMCGEYMKHGVIDWDEYLLKKGL